MIISQEQFDKEKDYRMRYVFFLVAEPALATQENFNNDKSWLVRCKIIEVNPSLATQENYDKQENIAVRSIIEEINPSITKK